MTSRNAVWGKGIGLAHRMKKAKPVDDGIINAVCAYFEIRRPDLYVGEISELYVRARVLCIFILHDQVPLRSSTHIARLLNISHTTVLHHLHRTRTSRKPRVFHHWKPNKEDIYERAFRDRELFERVFPRYKRRKARHEVLAAPAGATQDTVLVRDGGSSPGGPQHHGTHGRGGGDRVSRSL